MTVLLRFITEVCRQNAAFTYTVYVTEERVEPWCSVAFTLRVYMCVLIFEAGCWLRIVLDNLIALCVFMC